MSRGRIPYAYVRGNVVGERRMSLLGRTSAVLAALAVLGGVCAPAAPAASSAPSSPSAPSDPSAPSAASALDEPGRAITLVTGDVVRLFPNRGRVGYSVTGPDGKAGSARTSTSTASELRVIPSRVAELAGGILDLRLFEVTMLADAGLSDERAAALPLVVDLEPGASPTLPGLGRLVPAPGSSSVSVALARASADELGDALLAGDVGGVRAIRLDLPVDVEAGSSPLQDAAPLVDLTVHVRDRDGEVFATGERGWVNWNNIDDPAGYSFEEHISAGEEGLVTQVEPGRYALSLQAELHTREGDVEAVQVDLPEVVVDGPTEVFLDASTANKITVDVGRPAETEKICLFTYRANEAGERVLAIDGCLFRIHGATRAYVAPTTATTDGSYEFTSRMGLVGDNRRYDLVFPHPGQVPADPSEVVGPEDVAELRENFAIAPGRQHSMSRYAFLPHNPGSVSFEYPIDAPSRSVDWLSAGAVQWEEDALNLGSRIRQVPPGVSRRVRWFGQPLRPESVPISERTGNIMNWRVANWVDTDGHYRLPGRYYRRTFVLQADGRVIARARDAYRVLGVPAGPATFVGQLKSKGIGGSPVSRELDTTWTFDSETTEGAEPLPLLVIDYKLGADLRHEAPHPTPVELRVRHEARDIDVAIASCTLSASIDGGETWHPVELTETQPGRFAGTIDVPGGEPGDRVSLRVDAADAGSSSIAQEITAAYLVR